MRRMKTLLDVRLECGRMLAVLTSRHQWSNQDILTIKAAIEALEWVARPFVGAKGQYMKTRARIEGMMGVLREVSAAESDVDNHRRQRFAEQALGWVLEPRIVLPVLTCFTWSAKENGLHTLS